MTEAFRISDLNWFPADRQSRDHLMAKVSGAAWKVYCAIERLTIGWSKFTDWISNSQLMKITGLSKRAVQYGIQELLKYRAIIRKYQCPNQQCKLLRDLCRRRCEACNHYEAGNPVYQLNMIDAVRDQREQMWLRSQQTHAAIEIPGGSANSSRQVAQIVATPLERTTGAGRCFINDARPRRKELCATVGPKLDRFGRTKEVEEEERKQMVAHWEREIEGYVARGWEPSSARANADSDLSKVYKEKWIGRFVYEGGNSNGTRT